VNCVCRLLNLYLLSHNHKHIGMSYVYYTHYTFTLLLYNTMIYCKIYFMINFIILPIALYSGHYFIIPLGH